MGYVEYREMLFKRQLAAALIPSLVVLVLAVLPQPDPEGEACLTDGPQFECWLSER